ncbi:MAG: hypothetical protein ACT4P2_03195 [Pseudomonadota bacterium]
MPQDQAPLQRAGQLDIWRRFYDAQWRARAAFIASQIVSGEDDAYRILQKLHAKERKYSLEYQVGPDRSEYQRIDVADRHDLLPTRVPAFRNSSLRGKPVVVSFYTMTMYDDFLIDFIDETGPFDCIVELGCGLGSNLFEIFHRGGPRDIPYFGGELAAGGLQAANALRAVEKNLEVRFFKFDFTAPDLDLVRGFKAPLFFTLHAIEQVTSIGVDLFKTIAQAGERVTCVHLEPFGFQLGDLGDVTVAQRKAFLDRGWNRNLAPTLKAAQDAGILEIKYLAAEIFLPSDAANPTSLAVWESLRK